MTKSNEDIARAFSNTAKVIEAIQAGVSHFSVKRFSYGVLRGESGSSPLSRRSADLLSAGDRSKEGEEHKVRNSCQAEIHSALLRHKQAGNSVCLWQDEQVVWVAPEDIPDSFGN